MSDPTVRPTTSSESRHDASVNSQEHAVGVPAPELQNQSGTLDVSYQVKTRAKMKRKKKKQTVPEVSPGLMQLPASEADQFQGIQVPKAKARKNNTKKGANTSPFPAETSAVPTQDPHRVQGLQLPKAKRKKTKRKKAADPEGLVNDAAGVLVPKVGLLEKGHPKRKAKKVKTPRLSTKKVAQKAKKFAPKERLTPKKNKSPIVVGPHHPLHTSVCADTSPVDFSATVYLCNACNVQVRTGQEAVDCDECKGWSHR